MAATVIPLLARAPIVRMLWTALRANAEREDGIATTSAVMERYLSRL